MWRGKKRSNQKSIVFFLARPASFLQDGAVFMWISVFRDFNLFVSLIVLIWRWMTCKTLIKSISLLWKKPSGEELERYLVRKKKIHGKEKRRFGYLVRNKKKYLVRKKKRSPQNSGWQILNFEWSIPNSGFFSLRPDVSKCGSMFMVSSSCDGPWGFPHIDVAFAGQINDTLSLWCSIS